MLKMKLLPFALSGLVLAFSAQSADDNGQFAIDGAGAQQCKVYTNAWEQNSRDAYVFIGCLPFPSRASNLISRMPLTKQYIMQLDLHFSRMPLAK